MSSLKISQYAIPGLHNVQTEVEISVTINFLRTQEFIPKIINQKLLFCGEKFSISFLLFPRLSVIYWLLDNVLVFGMLILEFWDLDLFS